MPTSHERPTVETLRQKVAAGEVDNVIIAFTDMQGRLAGKRCSARYFLDEVLSHGAEACSYLLAVDVEQSTVSGYEISSWERGYGDFALVPDLATLRLLPWGDRAAMVQCDVVWADRSPVRVSPREVLKEQVRRLAEHGLAALVGTELEFIAFNASFEDAWNCGYRNLVPVNQYNVDYSVLGVDRAEPLLGAIRRGMEAAGLYVESVKGECNLGQHEIAFRYADALTTCDNHVVYKHGAKDIAASLGKSLTFMPKFNDHQGNSCHIHISLCGADGEAVLAGDGPHGFSPVMNRFIAGQLALLRELTLLLAPNINSYKRFAEGSFAPTTVAWGLDNRTCALRVVGSGGTLRLEHRVPGGDVNPYLAVAALIAAGLHGIEHDLNLEPMLEGNAYVSAKPRLPVTLNEATRLFGSSEPALKAFGEDVVIHYVRAAEAEVDAFQKAVTDWERFRCFERL